MAQKPKKKVGGPYLAAAVFCDQVIEDKDGAMTPVRIIDHVTLTVPANLPPEFPSDKDRLPVSVWALLVFKTGGAKGEHTVRLRMLSPTGKRSIVLEQSLPFRSEPHGGANLRVSVNLLVREGGLFWLDVILDGKRLTRMPLQVSIVRAGQLPTAPSDKGQAKP